MTEESRGAWSRLQESFRDIKAVIRDISVFEEGWLSEKKALEVGSKQQEIEKLKSEIREEESRLRGTRGEVGCGGGAWRDNNPTLLRNHHLHPAHARTQSELPANVIFRPVTLITSTKKGFLGKEKAPFPKRRTTTPNTARTMATRSQTWSPGPLATPTTGPSTAAGRATPVRPCRPGSLRKLTTAKADRKPTF